MDRFLAWRIALANAEKDTDGIEQALMPSRPSMFLVGLVLVLILIFGAIFLSSPDTEWKGSGSEKSGWQI